MTTPQRTRHKYGRHRLQTADLWLPPPGDSAIPAGSADLPVVVLIHGGWWQSRYTKALMNPLARDVAERGWAAWNIEYRRIGPLGGGGGWPATFNDVSAAIDHVAGLPGLDASRLITCGHSAGGHLALWVAGRWTAQPRDELIHPNRVRPIAAISLAGALDLRRIAAAGLEGGIVPKLLGGHPVECADRYAAASPAARLPIGVPQLIVHGTLDTVIPVEMSATYARQAAEAGDAVDYEAIEGAGHMDVIDPGKQPWSKTTPFIEYRVST